MKCVDRILMYPNYYLLYLFITYFYGTYKVTVVFAFVYAFLFCSNMFRQFYYVYFRQF